MKVLIIGAGTAGLYLSWKLAEKGEQVVVFERKKEIGTEVCSGLFSQRILEFIPQAERIIKNKIDFAYVNFPKKRIKLTFSKKFLVIEHYQLDEVLASLAEKAGAKIILDSNISKLPDGFDRIIGADGANSFVRKELGLKNPSFRLGMLGFVKEEKLFNYFEAWPCKNGFIWKIPRGRELEYGIVSDPKSASVFFKEFLEKNNIFIKDLKARIIPQGLKIPKNKRITLCGDSTGLTKPWSGGGVIWQLTSADMLLKNFPNFIEYQKEIKRSFYFKIILYKLMIKLVYFIGFRVPWLLPKTIKMESDFIFSFRT